MNNITNKRGNGVAYGESPHLINLTANPQALLLTETFMDSHEENYLSDNRMEGGTLVFQEESLIKIN